MTYWFPADPGSGIYFPGDLIRAALETGPAEGVIETFSHNLTELLDGRPGDTAHVRTASGALIPVPVAAITAIADAATPPEATEETEMPDTCWADPLTFAERRLVAVKLANAAQRFGNAPDPGRRKLRGASPADARMARRMASAEMADLHLDVTERAEVATS